MAQSAFAAVLNGAFAAEAATALSRLFVVNARQGLLACPFSLSDAFSVSASVSSAPACLPVLRWLLVSSPASIGPSVFVCLRLPLPLPCLCLCTFASGGVRLYLSALAASPCIPVSISSSPSSGLSVLLSSSLYASVCVCASTAPRDCSSLRLSLSVPVCVRLLLCFCLHDYVFLSPSIFVALTSCGYILLEAGAQGISSSGVSVIMLCCVWAFRQKLSANSPVSAACSSASAAAVFQRLVRAGPQTPEV